MLVHTYNSSYSKKGPRWEVGRGREENEKEISIVLLAHQKEIKNSGKRII